MGRFEKHIEIKVPVEELFAWHERPGAFDRLTPPWEDVRLVKEAENLKDGKAIVKVPMGPMHREFVAQHEGYIKNERFCDRQVTGPFRSWFHQHLFEKIDEANSVLRDKIEYQLPLPPFSSIASGFAQDKISSTFKYRHRITKQDLEFHSSLKADPMRIAVTGSTGLVGSSLVPFLTTGGHHVHRFVRSKSKMSNEDILWSTEEGVLENAEKLESCDAVVHLAGESIAEGRWSPEKKKRIRDSRVQGTKALAASIAQLSNKPKVLVSGSAIGIYGDTGDTMVDESGAFGSGFLEDVAREWEEATAVAEQAGIRVVHIRIGIILSPKGGALQKMLPVFNLGGGARLGSGKQYMSWISIEDMVRAILFVIANESISGPVNFTAPEPVTNADFTHILTRAMKRPQFPIPVPKQALQVAMGEMANELLFKSTRVKPQKLIEAGYPFVHSDLQTCLKQLLGK